MAFSTLAPICWYTPFPNLCSGVWYIAVIIFLLGVIYLITKKHNRVS